MSRFNFDGIRVGRWAFCAAWIGLLALGFPGPALGQCDPEVTAEIDDAVIDNLGAGDFFGYRVAMDGETAAVAAPWDDRTSPSSVSDCGSVRVFVRSGSTWVQQGLPLFASDASNADLMGWDLDISGDRIVAAAVNEDAIYVFTRVGTSWSQTAKITNPDAPSGGGGFGNSVAISGHTIVAGTENDSVADDFAGAMYIFVYDGANWVQQAKVRPSDTFMFSFQQMGYAVGVDGDTAVATSISGAAGVAAYVFVRSGSSWSEQQKLEPGDADGQGFGQSLAIDGDRIIVGAHLDSTTAGGDGAVYFFTRSGATWSQEAKVTSVNDGEGNDNFGYSVDLSGDTAVVGAYHDEYFAAANAGSAHILVRNMGAWSIQAGVTESSDQDPNDEFGASVAVDGDAALVGAPSDNWTNLVGTTTNDIGAATFYDLRCEGACCVNGECAIIALGDCNTLGGVFDGIGSVCTGMLCDPPCCRGDFNGDLTLDGLDVQGFTDALLMGATCP